MLKRGFRFEFEAPDGWAEEPENGRFLYRGPRGEALIVSGLMLTGTGPTQTASDVSDRLFQEAEESLNATARDPDLRVIRPLSADETISNCWTLHAETKDQRDLFAGAIFRGVHSVLLVTFEAPNRPESLEHYDSFLKSVRAAVVH